MSIDQVLIAALRPPQYQAAIDPANEVLCLACAGSGKSRTLAYRIARLVATGAEPKSIVAFTFTEKAAESIKRRVAEALRSSGIDEKIMGAMYIGTIHSYCQHVLGDIDARYRQFEVLDGNKIKLYLMSRFYELGLPQIRAGARYFEVIREVEKAWSMSNDLMLSLEEIEADDAPLGSALRNLSIALDRDQYLDFSLMIRRVVDHLRNGDAAAIRATSNLQHLMVDEYQDVSPSQEALIRLLHQNSSTLFAVGDDDQSIYAWRGAEVRNILTFAQRHPTASTHTLTENFRSTPEIVRVSDRFVSRQLSTQRLTKNPVAASDSTSKDLRVVWFQTRADEANWVADRIQGMMGMEFVEGNGEVRGLTPADFCILMRSTKGSGDPRHSPFSSALTARGIAYSLESGGGPFERPQVTALRVAFEQLRSPTQTREEARFVFQNEIIPAFRNASFDKFADVLADWRRKIHSPSGSGVSRRRVFPQDLVYDFLDAFNLVGHAFGPEVLLDIGLFSKMVQDVESVYVSVDSRQRFHDILNFLQNIAEDGYDVTSEDMLQRPDAVAISTVHKAKGLEYPAVFVVDVMSNRFPGTNRQYSGWIPASCIQQYLQNGAYQSRPEEEARLFYTAITRAERFLFVSGTESLPGGVRRWKRSPFTAIMIAEGGAAVTQDTLNDFSGLVRAHPKRRVDETVLPTSFSDIRYYLRCPMDYRFRKNFGFSPAIPEIFGFGKTVHTAVEKVHEMFPVDAPTGDEALRIAREIFHLKHVKPAQDPINHPGPYERARDKAGTIVREYVESYPEDFQRRRQIEARFEIPAASCVITGSIDLLLKEDPDGTISEAAVIDFKAIEGGNTPIQNPDLNWIDLSLQVQLYALAAKEILSESAKTGSVHLLKDSQRIEIPIDDAALDAALKNVEWAVRGIIARDYPMRPNRVKCESCDFNRICPKRREDFASSTLPPAIKTPTGDKMAESF